jgi:TolA-binding protein
MGKTKERLKDLQRTVETLQGRVQDMQWQLRQAQQRSLSERWWRNLLGARQENAFMSACCNRRVRPNTKMVNYAGTRSER